ncbi:3-methyladenine DNA glycosylase [Secundilactobacillus oryzae JCM 18671]|uniref:Putative 3-methyladenine DNA glycosylase n=1 Tax=Secundilactobacillus oryzae JCM 18671 TaxID=1291743 RepID=A0A081BJX6_9LACO|nr:DNA-3-methyladenine glycosylase [Secundilactobacillus oryzae]GAK48344.1 3-methyladenine DNA glycosylase [Secundilactobacillus oryzae JCM 18671]
MSQLYDFFTGRPTEMIARELLGKTLIYHTPAGTISGYVTEAEAYLGPNDSAAHAYAGKRTPANEALYREPGTIYIYSIHGRYSFDVATQAAGTPEGILVRGLEPAEGISLMEQNRAKHGFELTNGPGKLMEAFGINDKALNLVHLDDAPLTISLTGKEPQEVGESPRIGVSQKGDSTFLPLRYFVKGNPFVSGMRKRDMDLVRHGWQ